jgi:ribosomal protein S12 methylthiotransferase accessory factor
LEGAVDPESFALFAHEQHASGRLPFVPFTRSTRIRWARGRSLTTGADAWLPAQLVYLPWRRLVEGEEAVGYSTSSGLACAANADEALRAALLELVERDAFMITWAARLSFPRLTWSCDSELRAFERHHLAPAGLRHSAVDLSAIHDVPTVLAVVHADGRCPGELGVGAAAAPTVGDACRKALVEAYAVHRGARALALGPPRTFRDDFADVVEFADHIHVYALREHAVHAAFLDASRRRCSVGEVAPLEGEHAADHVAALVARLAARGLDAFCVDVTAPDVGDAGVHVVRAVVPGLCPLDVRHDARFLGADRLRNVPHELGLCARPLRIDELNPYPHPFP